MATPTTTTRDWADIRDHYDPGDPDPVDVETLEDDRAATEAAAHEAMLEALAELDAQHHDDESAPRLTLDALAELEADRFDAMGSDAGRLFASTMRDLAFKIRLTEATTAADFAARLEVLDDGIRAEYEAIGFEAGRSSCPCHNAFD